MRRLIKETWADHRRVWVTAIIVLLSGVSLAVTAWQWSWLGGGGSANASNSETLRNVGFLIAGVLAVVFAIWRAWVAERQANAAQAQAETAQRTLLNNQYQLGAEMLSSAVLAVRLAGIYVLQTLAEQQPEAYHLQVMHMLGAFVRNPPKDDILYTPVVFDGEAMPLRIREDAQAALSAIARRNARHIELENEEGFRVNLRGANSRNGNFRRCLLGRADLSWADLTDADLESASLVDADLTYANLSVAHMSGANFRGSICGLARISGAKAHDANFTRADLEGTIWNGAELENASLSYATLRGADLTRATLSGADISGTKFGRGRRRNEDYSQGALLIFAREAYTSLTQEQLDQAAAAHDCPPEIEYETNDAETGVQLVWKGQTAS